MSRLRIIWDRKSFFLDGKPPPPPPSAVLWLLIKPRFYGRVIRRVCVEPFACSRKGKQVGWSAPPTPPALCAGDLFGHFRAEGELRLLC